VSSKPFLDKFCQRSVQPEHIDLGDYTAEEYEGCIAELQFVNKWMGDARTLRRTFFKDIQESALQNFSVLDVGAGSGELLRVTVSWARRAGKRLSAVGLELNERSAQAIAEESGNFGEINSVRGNALELPFCDRAFDYVISSLFTHHLTDDQIVETLREMNRVASRRIFVIDLHRHPVAYFLYTTVGKLVLHTRLLREDGALSILRSFKPGELLGLAERAGLENVSVERHFPYRLVLSAATARKAQTSSLSAPAPANTAGRAA
jgi:ubiquinone/menaquinone biosynthesis C-methylase UbiE